MHINTHTPLSTYLSCNKHKVCKKQTKKDDPLSSHQSINQLKKLLSKKKKKKNQLKNKKKKSSKSGINQEEAKYSSSGMMREKASSVEREKPKPKPKPKQIRRRLHTRKPYQEKLLNMAEARREIVTALKLHRASKMQSKPYTCPHPQNYTPPPPTFFDDFVLPDQTLGLNLNLEDFIMTTSSTSSTPSSSTAVVDQFYKFGEDHEELVTSPFDDVMEFPSWLNANDQHVLHDFSNLHDPTLPCMDIEEIEGMDGDWLA